MSLRTPCMDINSAGLFLSDSLQLIGLTTYFWGLCYCGGSCSGDSGVCLPNNVHINMFEKTGT